MSLSKTDNVKEDDIFAIFLTDELTLKEQSAALKYISDDPELLKQLRLDMQLARNFHQQPDSFEVPENFADDVMAEIDAYETRRMGVKNQKTLPLRLVRSLLKSRNSTYRPASLLAAAVAIIVFLGALNFYAQTDLHTDQVNTVTSTHIISDQASDEVWIRFVYIDDGASEIAVAGNFSDWEPIKLDRRVMGDKTVWSGLVPVERGEHRYMFIRNGEEWISDPLAEIQRDDGFGNKNAVIYL